MQWMSNEVQMADHVLVICDERYVEKVDGHHGGVAWEAMLIQSDMFRLMQKKADSAKYIPIVRTLDEYDGLPGFLGTKLWIHWPDGADRDAKRSELLDALFPRRREPPLGVPG
jgi:hypothetical protein